MNELEAITASGADIEDMVTGYLECQLWAGHDMDRDEDGNSPTLDENYGLEDISAEYVEAVTAEISEIVAYHPLAVRMYLARRSSGDFGHDFYLTREGHGAGFWDRGLGDLGDYLTGIAKSYGEAAYLWDRDGVLTA